MILCCVVRLCWEGSWVCGMPGVLVSPWGREIVVFGPRVVRESVSLIKVGLYYGAFGFWFLLLRGVLLPGPTVTGKGCGWHARVSGISIINGSGQVGQLQARPCFVGWLRSAKTWWFWVLGSLTWLLLAFARGRINGYKWIIVSKTFNWHWM